MVSKPYQKTKIHHFRSFAMIGSNCTTWGSPIRYSAACLAAGLLVWALWLAPASADDQPATEPTLAIKGTCKFGGTESTWSATLTPKGKGLYDAVYTAKWGGKPLAYTGQIKTDPKSDLAIVRIDAKGSLPAATAHF